MFCEFCGAGAQVASSYCRRCGQWLGDKSGRKDGKPDDRMQVMMIFNVISALMACTSAISLYATYLGRPEAKWSIYMAGALCTVIAVHQSISFGFALSLRLRARRLRETYGSLDLNAGAQRAALQAGATDPMADFRSVTEVDTELLVPVARKKITK